jgi:hypothetical protein
MSVIVRAQSEKWEVTPIPLTSEQITHMPHGSKELIRGAIQS